MRLEHKYSVRHGHLPLAALKTHPQMRLTINEEGIEELAENILRHGLIHPICVAHVDASYVVISGHRRLRACRLLEERGHRDGEIAVTVFENLTLIEMALLQASENIHEQVPAHEAAKFYEATWRALKIAEPGFTLTDFAKAVGRNEQTIRNALRFALLPQRIQDFVSSDSFSYGAAIQLTRLSEIVDEVGLEQWAIRFVISPKKVSEVREQIETYMRDISSGQLNMLDVFEANTRRILEQESRRILIDRATVTSFWGGIAFSNDFFTCLRAGSWSRRILRGFAEIPDMRSVNWLI